MVHPVLMATETVSGHEGDGEPLDVMMVTNGQDGNGAPSGLCDPGSPAMMAMVILWASWSPATMKEHFVDHAQPRVLFNTFAATSAKFVLFTDEQHQTHVKVFDRLASAPRLG